MAKTAYVIKTSPKSSAQRKAERPSRVTVTRPPKVKAALDPKAKLRPKQRAATLSVGVGADVGAVKAALPSLSVLQGVKPNDLNKVLGKVADAQGQPEPKKLHPQLREYDVPNSVYKLLGPKKGIEPVDLTLEARVQMAQRSNALINKLPRYVDKRALEVIQEEGRKREEHRKKESEERIKKLRERRGAADDDDDQPGTRKLPNQGGIMKAAKKAVKAKPAPAGKKPAAAAAAPKAPSAASVKSRMAGLPPYTEATKVTWLIKENPRRPGSETHANWKRYYGAGTVGELFKRGGFPGQLRWDLRHKYLKLG